MLDYIVGDKPPIIWLKEIKFGGNKMKTYTKFDLERLQGEYNNAGSKRSEEVILQMIEEVKAEIGEGVR